MRKSFDGLCAATRQVLEEDPLCGALFVFRNRRRDRVKLLYWDDDGLAIWYKRLEKGTFVFPSIDVETDKSIPCKLQVRASDLMMLLDGVDLKSVKRQKRFSLSKRERDQAD